MPSISAQPVCTPTPAEPPAPCSRSCRERWSSSSSRPRWPASRRPSSGSRSASWCGSSTVREPVGPWVTVLVYLPRDRFTAELPERVADAVAVAYSADRRTFESAIGASTLARITVSVRCGPSRPIVDTDALERAIDELSTSWSDRLRAALLVDVGEERARDLFDRVGASAPPAYIAAVAPERAIGDIRRIADLVAGDAELATSLGHDVDAPAGEWRFRVYRRGAPAALSELLPLLDHARRPGARRAPVHVPAAAPSASTSTTSVCASTSGIDLDEQRRGGAAGGVPRARRRRDRRRRLQPARAARRAQRPRGHDRALLRQVPPPDRVHVQPALHRGHAGCATRRWWATSSRCSTPGSIRPVGGAADRLGRMRSPPIVERITDALDAIPSLDDDRICRAFLVADQRHRADERLPRPAGDRRSSSTRRRSPTCRRRGRSTRSSCARRGSRASTCAAGAIARGGLRWSDRREDFRTEVLGLVKAQMVKNAVIVPVGAKGGFVVKRPPSDARGACGPRSSSATGRSSAGCSTSPTTSWAPPSSASCTRRTP